MARLRTVASARPRLIVARRWPAAAASAPQGAGAAKWGVPFVSRPAMLPFILLRRTRVGPSVTLHVEAPAVSLAVTNRWSLHPDEVEEAEEVLADRAFDEGPGRAAIGWADDGAKNWCRPEPGSTLLRRPH